MNEHEQTATVAEGQAEEDFSWQKQNGMVAGIAGKRIGINGVLDLRGVPADQVAGIEELRINGLVLMDERNRSALSGVRSEVNGTIMVAPSDMRVMIQPEIEFSKASLEAMPTGQKLMVIGNIFFRPDAPPALVAEKFEDLRLVGIIVMGEGVQGALLGKTEITGVSIIIPEGVAGVVRSIGGNTWSTGYLAQLPDKVAYVNIGNTSIPDDITAGLVAQKIASYHNVGETVAPQEILDLLKSRCATNTGQFTPLEDTGARKVGEAEKE